MPDEPGVPRDRAARPSLDEVLALRADRMATVRQVIADLTDDDAGRHDRTGHRARLPRVGELPRRRCLRVILNEEWEHRLFAERDLDILESRGKRAAAESVRKSAD